MSEIIAVVNQKGGVSKTTTSINLAAYLADAGFKTLLIDADSQGNASSGLGIKKDELTSHFYHFLMDNQNLDKVLVHTELENLDLLPANKGVVGIDHALAELDNRERTLKSRLDQYANLYDYILIDSPPNLSLLSVNIMVAANSLIIPTPPEYMPLEGLAELIETFKRVRQAYNPNLTILGVLVTKYMGNNNLSKEVTQNLKQNMGSLIFDSVIPNNVRIAEAPGFGKPILLYDPRCSGAMGYQSLAKEVISRTKTKNN